MTNPMNEPNLSDILRIVELALGRRPVGADDLLIENFGAESADIAGIVTALEDRFGVSIPESALPKLRTARDFYELLRAAR